MSKTINDGFMTALAIYNLTVDNRERAQRLVEATQLKDDRYTYVERLLDDHTVATTAWRQSRPAGVYTHIISAEILSMPADVEQRFVEATAVHLTIDSPGGDCGAALRLLGLLATKPATVSIGHAGSAAALLAACVPGRRTISSTGSMMLHPVCAFAFGDVATLRRTADWLERRNKQWIELLSARTGQPTAVVESWLTGANLVFSPEQALAAGLVDEIALPRVGAVAPTV